MSHTIGKTEKSSAVHKHLDYEVNISLGDAAVFRCGKINENCTEGKIFIIPPNFEHQFIQEEDFQRIYIAGDFNSSFNFAAPIIISAGPKNEGQILAEMIYNNKYGNQKYLRSLINAFSGFVLQNIKTDNELGTAIKEITHTVSKNFYNSELNLCELLNQSGYAEDYIRAKFKAITGKTPVEFLSKVRISHACFLMDTYKNAITLNEISEKCGYTDYAYFSRSFKKIMGISPRDYMNNMGEMRQNTPT